MMRAPRLCRRQARLDSAARLAAQLPGRAALVELPP
jgi:hypothetical protein